MTALDLPDFGVFEARRARGRWSLVAGGTVETRPRAGVRRIRLRRGRATVFPLVSGAIVVGDPVHQSVGEVAVAVDKRQTVRLTLADATALGNRRYSLELIVSALGEDAGPDVIINLEGYCCRGRDGVLRVVLSGQAPAALGSEGSRMRLNAAFSR
jgi:hypothetical protein